MGEEDLVILEIENNIASITFNNTKTGNSLNVKMINELIHVLKKLECDNKIRIVIITGKGKFFCTGMNLSGSENNEKIDPNLLFKTLLNFPKPIISKINGPAIAGGIKIIF